MTTVAQDAAARDDDATQPTPDGRRPGRYRLVRRILWQPLSAILAIQAGLSLALVWSNTAYIDEADYLWIGHLLLGHWLHGTTWPASLAKSTLSGSPVIYPPIGALADSVAGLAGARILSMLFMLTATVLLYSATSTILGRKAAIFASAFWALSEPAMRLAFATYDPLSVLLTTLSAWLIVQASYRRHRIVLAVLSAVVLALANATAYSGIVIDPIVVAFAFLVWWPSMGARRALAYSSGIAAGLVGGFALVMVATGSWAGTGTVFDRQSHDHESVTLVLNEIWGYSGFLIALALIGVLIAIRLETRQRALLMALLWCAVFAAPAAQFHYGTAWSADKHVAYGFWFAAMAAGYGCAKLVSWPAGARTRLVAACCAIALVYPAAYGFATAWQRYHLWQNSAAFITALRPVIAHAPNDLIYVPGHQANIAQYYLPQGRDWQRWSAALALNPAGLPKSFRVLRPGWWHYYQKWLKGDYYGNYGTYSVIVLFYGTSFTGAASLSPSNVASGALTPQSLLALVGKSTNEPGLPLLTDALAHSKYYRYVTSGPYNIANTSGTDSNGSFVIWRRV
jgi:hypothetical protein